MRPISIHTGTQNDSEIWVTIDTYVLLVTGTVVVLVGLRGKKVHIRDNVEETLLQRGVVSGGRRRCESSSGGYGGNQDGGGGLHGCWVR